MFVLDIPDAYGGLKAVSAFAVLVPVFIFPFSGCSCSGGMGGNGGRYCGQQDGSLCTCKATAECKHAISRGLTVMGKE
jgi:hypothetical protein